MVPVCGGNGNVTTCAGLKVFCEYPKLFRPPLEKYDPPTRVDYENLAHDMGW